LIDNGFPDHNQRPPGASDRLPGNLIDLNPTVRHLAPQHSFLPVTPVAGTGRIWETLLPAAIAPSVTRQEYVRALVVITVCLLVSLWLQIQVSPSPMTADESTWQLKLDMHLNHYPFSIRPLQSYATLGLHTVTGLPIRESFFSIQFALAVLLGLAFYRLMRQMHFAPGRSLVGLILLMTAYPIIGAHWEPTHTWDDFWAYLFLVFAISACLRRQVIFAAIWFSIAILAREPVIVFYPIVAFLLLSGRPAPNRARLLAGLALPVLFFASMRLFFAQPMDSWRWPITLMGNFFTPLERSDALVSIIISFGFIWLLSAIGLYRILRAGLPDRHSWLVWAGLITVPATLALTLAGALARETRILFPPFLCMIPLSVVALESLAAFWRPRLNRRTGALLATLFVLCIAGGVTAANLVLFPKFHYTTNERVRRPLAGFHLGAIVALGCLFLYQAREKQDGKSSRRVLEQKEQ
jgi:hypothetical protein